MIQDASVTLWLNNGAIASKLLLGIGAYGKSFTLTSTDNVGTGASVSGAGSAGTYTQEAGTLAYYEVRYFFGIFYTCQGF